MQGNWGAWNMWSFCSAKCGPGKRERMRRCENPAPKYDGDNCMGSDRQTMPCSLSDCPGEEHVFLIWVSGEWVKTKNFRTWKFVNILNHKELHWLLMKYSQFTQHVQYTKLIRSYFVELAYCHPIKFCPTDFNSTLLLPCSSVQTKYKTSKNMNSVQLQREHHH